MLKEILFAYFFVVMAIFIHLLIMNIRPIKYRYRLIFIIGMLGFVLYVILSAIVTKSMFLFINGAISFMVTFSLYTYNFTTIERSLSVDLLVELENADKKGLELEKMIEVVVEKEVKKRLKYFLVAKYISENEGRFKITKKGHFYALLGGFLRKLMGLS